MSGERSYPAVAEAGERAAEVAIKQAMEAGDPGLLAAALVEAATAGGAWLDGFAARVAEAASRRG